MLANTHDASSRPIAVPTLQRPASSGSTSAAARLAAAGQRSLRASSAAGVDFQRASGPTPINSTTGAISGTNTVSK